MLPRDTHTNKDYKHIIQQMALALEDGVYLRMRLRNNRGLMIFFVALKQEDVR